MQVKFLPPLHRVEYRLPPFDEVVLRNWQCMGEMRITWKPYPETPLGEMYMVNTQ